MKKLLSILLAIALVVSGIPMSTLAAGDTGGDESTNGSNTNNDTNNYPTPSPEVPNLTVTSQNTYTGKAGETVNVTVTLKNTSKYYATNVSATLNGDDTGTVYVEGDSYGSTRDLNGGSSESLSFKVKVADLAEAGNYKLNLNVSYYNYAYSDEIAQKYTLERSINIRVPKKTNAPQVLVDEVNIMPSNVVKPGDTIAVGFNLKNIGPEVAKDIKISLEGLSSEGFTVAKGVNYTTVPSIGPGKSSYLYFELKSLRNINPGSYELLLKLTYKDKQDELITDESKFFITVIAGDKKNQSNLILENLKYPTGTIPRNTALDINFDIKNKGRVDANNIIIKAISSDPSGVVPKSVSILKIDTLKSEETQNINFEFLTTNSAQTTNYPIEILVEYEDDMSPKGEPYSFNQFVGVFSKAPIEKDPNDKPEDTSQKYVPKLIIEKYTFNPSMVKAGETFEMSLSFFNTNKDKSVRNIKIFLTSESGASKDSADSGSSVFTPVDSSNTFFIDSIPAKQTIDKTITMFTIPDALAKTHTITANLEYEDAAGNAYTAKELIGVPVVQQSRLEVGALDYFPEVSVGEPVPITAEFYNTGKVTLYNLMVKLEGDFQTENGQHYVGNFESGSSDFFDGTVIPSETGELEGALVFTYEDSTGETQEVRQSFSLNVIEMMPMDEFPDDMEGMPEENGGFFRSNWMWILLAVILLAAGVLFFRLRKKKKRDKEMSLDE